MKPSIVDSGDSVEAFTFSWYLDSELVSNSQEYSIAQLDEGTHSVLLMVIDDDGANDSYQIEIVIKSDNDNEANNLSYGSVVVLVGIIGFSILMISRIKNKDSESKSLPKWKETVNRSDHDVQVVSSNESELWD